MMFNYLLLSLIPASNYCNQTGNESVTEVRDWSTLFGITISGISEAIQRHSAGFKRKSKEGRVCRILVIDVCIGKSFQPPAQINK